MRAVDAFGGFGGASRGLIQAGVTDVQSIEFDPRAARAHDHICGGSTIVADVAALDPAEFRGIDLLWMSPPCQPFSAAGLKKGLDDPRGQLIFEVPRWVKTIRPPLVVCEQVKGALGWWRIFEAELAHLGYSTWTGVLRAEQYGVPQTRERAILIASLDHAVTPPPSTHRKFWNRRKTDGHVAPGDEHLPRWMSMHDVGLPIGQVGFPRLDDTGTSDSGYRERDWRSTEEPAFTITEKARSWTLLTGQQFKVDGDRSTALQYGMDVPAPTFTGKAGTQWWLLGPKANHTMRHLDQPAPTITAGHRS